MHILRPANHLPLKLWIFLAIIFGCFPGAQGQQPTPIRQVTLGVGQTKLIPVPKVVGRGSVPLSNDPTVAIAGVEAGSLKVEAKRPGSALISFGSGRKLLWLRIEVRPVAADFPQTLEATVSGRPAMVSTVMASIDYTLKRNLQRAKGSQMSYRVDRVNPVVPGQTADFYVHVWVKANELVPTDGLVRVKVVNEALDIQSESSLLFSNSPERITKPGNLYAAMVEPGSSVRLLYHQINAGVFPVVTRTLLVNDSDSVSRVFLIPGDAPPLIDPVDSGMRAVDQFFQPYLLRSGEVVDIPAHSVLPLSFRRLRVNQVTSGLCYIRHISGSQPLLVRSDAISPSEVDPTWSRVLTLPTAERSNFRDSDPTLGSSTPWHDLGCPAFEGWLKTPYSISKTVYPDPFQTLTTVYEVGGRFGYVRIGEVPIVSQETTIPLHGNFGVNSMIAASLQNPTQNVSEAEVIFEASAGYSSAIFMVDNKYVVVDRIQPHAERRIARVTLNPGEIRNMLILTIPLSGSSYPATLLIRPAR